MRDAPKKKSERGAWILPRPALAGQTGESNFPKMVTYSKRNLDAFGESEFTKLALLSGAAGQSESNLNEFQTG
jgi:hypothetical protein